MAERRAQARRSQPARQAFPLGSSRSGWGRGAAAERHVWRPRVPPGFVGWVFARLVAMAVVLAGGWAVYTASTSTEFQVRKVHVLGASLLSQADVEDAAAVIGANVFWVDHAAAEARLQSLPLVVRAEVTPVLPDSVEVRIQERQPAAFWVSGDRTYVVDKDGVVLRPLAEDEGVYAEQPLPTVAEVDGQALTAGDTVDASALTTWARLAALLPTAGVKPKAAQWSAQFGLEVQTQDGWRARFSSAGGENLERQVDSLRAIRDYLAKNKTAAEVIDVRFGDRPYYR
jgi:cell division septal protein FtsQ